jgi:hypothetical protein
MDVFRKINALTKFLLLPFTEKPTYVKHYDAESIASWFETSAVSKYINKKIISSEKKPV